MSVTASTFARVTSVIVNSADHTSDVGLYPDNSLLPGGSNVSAVVPINGTTATVGQLWRGMPAYYLPTTGKLVPPNNAASGTAIFAGVLADDLTAYVIARQTKVTFVKRGRVRTYAAETLAAGDPVKPDTASNFAGFKKWVDGTDSVELLAGRAYPLDDGSASNGSTAATTMAQGDVIFLDLLAK